MSFLKSALILSLFHDWGPTTKMVWGSVIARGWWHAHKIRTTFSLCVECESKEWEREKEELRRRVRCGVKPTISIHNLVPPACQSFHLSSEISQHLLNEWAQNLKHANNYQMLAMYRRVWLRDNKCFRFWWSPHISCNTIISSKYCLVYYQINDIQPMTSASTPLSVLC